MTNLTFSQALAQQYFNSSEQFPIDFDDAWVWLELDFVVDFIDKN